MSNLREYVASKIDEVFIETGAVVISGGFGEPEQEVIDSVPLAMMLSAQIVKSAWYEHYDKMIATANKEKEDDA